MSKQPVYKYHLHHFFPNPTSLIDVIKTAKETSGVIILSDELIVGDIDDYNNVLLILKDAGVQFKDETSPPEYNISFGSILIHRII